MAPDESNIIRRNTLFPLSDGEAHDFKDALALAWIFSAALSAGFMVLAVNRFSLAAAGFSLSLGFIWWILSHLRHRRS